MNSFLATSGLATGSALLATMLAFPVAAASGCDQIELLRKHAKEEFRSIKGKKGKHLTDQYESTLLLPGAKSCDVETDSKRKTGQYRCEFLISQQEAKAKATYNEYSASWVACAGQPNTMERIVVPAEKGRPEIPTMSVNDLSNTRIEIYLDYYAHWWSIYLHYHYVSNK
jgi:hypothetical protein